MPTIITHAAIPLALGVALGATRIPPRLLALTVFASMLPDLDVIAFKLGISYAHDLGHRGISHSLIFAATFAACLAPCADWLKSTRLMVFYMTFIATASHGLLDMLTNGGLGVAYFWPFSHERYFFPTQVIQVSPLSLQRVFSAAGLKVMYSELLWVWLPCLLLAAMATMRRKWSTT